MTAAVRHWVSMNLALVLEDGREVVGEVLEAGDELRLRLVDQQEAVVQWSEILDVSTPTGS